MTGEAQVRLGFFFGILTVMALWEILAPRRPLTTTKAGRWAGNFGIVFLDTLALRLLFPGVAVVGYVYGALLFGTYLRRSRAPTVADFFWQTI